ncbi:dipeptidyl peptidase 4-like [Pollicipes pollicipes]|uniref:dipeptidyl peptidase 4-like n=1 Tax=Pollicipes pollicipes TaxID=41117 RepID=UPI0018854158|nr:dipeptidyl peptidase 4-like [Pollicipes pollicipes]
MVRDLGYGGGGWWQRRESVGWCEISGMEEVAGGSGANSAYTERYMGLPGPRGNYRGYEESDLTSRAALFKNKNFFLIHGTADDNVHVQHSMLLSRALIRAGVSFRQQIYPDENHFLSGVKKHMFTMMEDFIDRCFLPPKRIIDEALEKLRKKKKIP